MHERPTSPTRKESGLVQRVRASLKTLPMDVPRVLVACSGGADSVALASVLADLHRLDCLHLTIAHIHHGQHRAADTAADCVRLLGESLGITVVIAHLEQDHIAAHQGVGLEEAMRRERYLALTRIAVEQETDVIALAHHQRDQAETLLLHVLRGAGIDGLVAMREIDERRIPWWTSIKPSADLLLWRPLLTTDPQELRQLIADRGLRFVEDPTNLDPGYRRNGLRLRVLPLLEDIAPGSTAAIARSAGVLAGERDVLADVTKSALMECLGGDGLVRERLVEFPGGLQARIVRLWLITSGITDDLGSNRIDAIAGAIRRNRGGATIEVGQGCSVRIERGVARLERAAVQPRHEREGER